MVVSHFIRNTSDRVKVIAAFGFTMAALLAPAISQFRDRLLAAERRHKREMLLERAKAEATAVIVDNIGAGLSAWRMIASIASDLADAFTGNPWMAVGQP